MAMNYPEQYLFNRAEYLGATDDGFIQWMKFVYNLKIEKDRLEFWKSKKWEEYLNALEISKKTIENDRSQYE